MKNEISDSRITDAIVAQFRVTKSAKELDLKVSSSKGIVTIIGTVPDSKVQEELETIAENTNGVKEVNSKLVVNSKLGNDLIVTKKVRANLLNEKLIKSLNILIETEDGEVTVTGEVPNKDTQKLIELIVKKTNGVTNVVSNLVINSNLENK